MIEEILGSLKAETGSRCLRRPKRRDLTKGLSHPWRCSWLSWDDLVDDRRSTIDNRRTKEESAAGIDSVS